MAGNVQFVVDTFGVMLPLHREGRLRILAVLHETRSKAAPDIPTSGESGLPGLIAGTFNLLAAPAGTPAPVIARLAAAVRQTMAEEAFRAELEAIAIEPVAESGPEHAARTIQAEIAKWRPIIEATGVSIE